MSGDRGTMTACRIVEWGRPPELVEVPVPTVGAGQVLVEVAGCGLCHSDITMAAMPGEVGASLGWQVPFTLGHEAAGRVAELGAGVEGFDIGDPVALVSPSSCGVCAHCRADRESVCPNGDSGRGYGRDGALAAYVRVDSTRDLLPLGDFDPRHAGPLTDAGATSYHAVRKALPALEAKSIEASSTVVVIGAGGLGAFTIQILRTITDARIVAVDLDPVRRDLALTFGASAAIDGAADRLGRTLKAEASHGLDGVDAVIDVVGTDATISAGIAALRRGGSFVLVGAGGGGYGRPWMGGLPREASITSIQGSSISDAQAVIDLAAAGRITVPVDEFPLHRVNEAYAALEAGNLIGRAVVIP